MPFVLNDRLELHMGPSGLGAPDDLEAAIVCGSFNYTDPANRLNDENILVIGDLEDENPVAQEAQRRLADFALQEIDRLIAAHGERVLLSA